MKAAVRDLLERIVQRNDRFPVLGYVEPLDATGNVRGWVVATDGIRALMVRDAHAWEWSPITALMTKTLFPPCDFSSGLDIAALKEWAGEAPRAAVLRCPSWERHEQYGTDEGDDDDGDCFYGCQFVPGLGFAYEAETRELEWGAIGGIVVDKTRLATLLSCWPDGTASYGVDDGCLHVRADALGFRLALMRGEGEGVGPAFEDWAADWRCPGEGDVPPGEGFGEVPT